MPSASPAAIERFRNFLRVIVFIGLQRMNGYVREGYQGNGHLTIPSNERGWVPVARPLDSSKAFWDGRRP
jgi:hypothetical protein